MRKLIAASILLVSLVFALSCRKDPIIDSNSNIKLTFSRDTVIFDTVFVSKGSATYQLKVYNPSSNTINVSNIKLARGNSSPYRINVDGLVGTEIKDLEINGKDSLFIFIEVTIDPGNTNNPFIVQDSILFLTNGNLQDVDLVAWGQNAHYIYPDTFWEGFPPFSILGCDTTWRDDIPHVIYGFAVVDSTCNFVIEEGSKIYFHNNSGLWVYKGGSIKVNGTKEKPVIFQGDRLDPFYKDQAGAWNRIWLNEGSVDNEFNYAIIKNGFVGIQAETFDNPMGNQLILNNTIIENMSGMGILARRYKITANNSLINNCGQYALALTLGGEYELNNCTVANYWPFGNRKTPSVILTNHYKDYNNNLYLSHLVKANFNNCIVYGNQENEFLTDKIDGTDFNYLANNCLIKTNKSIAGTNNYFNTDPLFKDGSKRDFHLGINSPAIDNGNSIYLNSITNKDLDGVFRNGNPDIGCFEYTP